jgi:predicted ATP-grasp superfamily ATP-dependent carboligase
MTSPLQLPISISNVGGSGGSGVSNISGTTYITAEQVLNDNTLRLIADSVEVLTVTSDKVTINGGIKEKVDAISTSMTVLPSQTVLTVDAIAGTINIELPLGVDNIGRKLSFIRLDNAVANAVNIKPSVGEKLNTTINQQVSLGPGDHFKVQCIGATEGWFLNI